MRGLNSREKEIFEAVVRLCAAGLKPLWDKKGAEVCRDSSWGWGGSVLSPVKSAIKLLARSIGLTRGNEFHPGLENEYPDNRVLEEARTAMVEMSQRQGQFGSDCLKTYVLFNFLVYTKMGHWFLEVVSSADLVYDTGKERYLKAGGAGDGRTFGWEFEVRNKSVLRYLREISDLYAVTGETARDRYLNAL